MTEWVGESQTDFDLLRLDAWPQEKFRLCLDK